MRASKKKSVEIVFFYFHLPTEEKAKGTKAKMWDKEKIVVFVAVTKA
jgi:hypothetical protein